MNGIELMNQGKLNKALDRKYNFSNGGIMPLRDYLDNQTFVRRTHTVRNISSKRVCLEYIKIKETHNYTLWAAGDKGIDVPKMVYDTYPNLPEVTNLKVLG